MNITYQQKVLYSILLTLDKSCDPEWLKHEIPVMFPNITHYEALQLSYLKIVLKDRHSAVKTDHFGSIVVKLDQALDGEYNFSQRIVDKGTYNGVLEGCFSFVWIGNRNSGPSNPVQIKKNNSRSNSPTEGLRDRTHTIGVRNTMQFEGPPKFEKQSFFGAKPSGNKSKARGIQKRPTIGARPTATTTNTSPIEPKAKKTQKTTPEKEEEVELEVEIEDIGEEQLNLSLSEDHDNEGGFLLLDVDDTDIEDISTAITLNENESTENLQDIIEELNNDINQDTHDVNNLISEIDALAADFV